MKIRIRTTNTDVAKPEIELSARIRRSDGDVDRASVNILNENIIIDQATSNNNSGDWVTNALNDGHIYYKETGEHSYSLKVDGSATLGMNVPGKLGEWIPTSVDWQYTFKFNFINISHMNGIDWNHSVKMKYSKWGFNFNTYGVEYIPNVSFTD